MKEVIYTIPINDAYDEYCGCPVCRLEQKLNSDAVEYVMGAAMMEPDIRIETNRLGFCPRHFSEMMSLQNRLSIGLMLQSYLNELLSEVINADTKHMGKRELTALSDKLTERSDSCFVCDRVDDKLGQYIRNIIYLWESDMQFREKTKKQEFFCPKHLSMLTRTAVALLSKRNYGAFCDDHFTGARRELSSLSEDITKFCNSFNYMFRDVPLGSAKTAIERTISFLNGNKK